MSLLADLNLAYETLSDDPINMGIHYGQSILNALSSTKPTTLNNFVMPISNLTTRKQIARPVAIRPKVRPTSHEAKLSTLQREFASYTSRRPNERELPRTYTSRSLIGAI